MNSNQEYFYTDDCPVCHLDGRAVSDGRCIQCYLNKKQERRVRSGCGWALYIILAFIAVVVLAVILDFIVNF